MEQGVPRVVLLQFLIKGQDMVDAIVIGNVCLDVIPQFKNQSAQTVDRLIIPGRMTELTGTVVSLGGGVPNTGLNLNQLGIRTALVGKIGDDAFGQLVREFIQQYHPELATGLIVSSEDVTSHTIIIDPPQTDRALLHCSGATRTFGIEDVPYDLVAEIRLLHFAYPTHMPKLYPNHGQMLVEIFRRAKELGATTSLDLAMPDPHGVTGQIPWHDILPHLLSYVDVFTPSFEELLYMLDRPLFSMREAAHETLAHFSDDVPLLAEKALALGAHTVFIKCGTSGGYLRTAATLIDFGRGAPADLTMWTGRELWAPAFRPDQVAGTTGSGDASIAGFLAALLRGLSPEDTLKTAMAVGAFSVEAPNSLSGIRGWGETTHRIASGWDQMALTVQALGWMWDGGQRLWIGPHDATR